MSRQRYAFVRVWAVALFASLLTVTGFVSGASSVAATTALTTSVLVPANGATVSGSTYLDASASNATSVEFLLFGGTYGFDAPVICTATLTYYGWLCDWNTTTVPNGSYTLVTEAFNSGGSTYSSGVTMTVKNPLPTTSILIPSNGATLSGTTTLDASASNATSVEFLLFGGTYGFDAPVICTATLTYYGWVCSWKTTTVPIGAYILVSLASGPGGSTASSGVDITVGHPLIATAITTGGFDSCAIVPGGTVECWGYNYNGQLGNGTTENSSTPVTVTGLTGARALSAGDLSTCAVLSPGYADCWGDNTDGELGDDRSVSSLTPVEAVDIGPATLIAVGDDYACATPAIECWGDNEEGQTGPGFLGGFALTPQPVTGLGVTEVTALAAQGMSTCGLLTGGTVDCWGANANGQLGNGTTTDSGTPVPVSGLTRTTAIAGGDVHACALLTGGTVDCWGDNTYGELGNGTTTDSSTPVAVSGLSGVTAIAAGNYHTCALLTGRTVECWGYNAGGELGNGTTTDSSIPVAVRGLTGVTAISAGGGDTCAIVTGGTVECWGDNAEGELGDGTNSGPETCVSYGGSCSTSPVDVTDLP